MTRQLARIAAVEHPGRFGLLIAADSAGGLIAAEMTAAGLPWRPTSTTRCWPSCSGPRPAGWRGTRARRTAAGPAGGADGADLGGVRRRAAGEPGLAGSARPGAGRQTGSRCHRPGSSVLREIDHPAIPLLLEYKELARLHAALRLVVAGHLGVGGAVPAGVRGGRGGLGPLGDPGAAGRCRFPGRCAARWSPIRAGCWWWPTRPSWSRGCWPRWPATRRSPRRPRQGDLYTALASAFGGDRRRRR